MRVLQINSVCGIGSTGRIATDIHKMLIEQGHESYIAYGRGEAKNCNNSIRIGNNLDVLFHVLLTRFFDMHGFGSKRATKKFIKKVKEINPDVIHLHNIHGYYINIEVLFNYLKESGKKVVWTLHDCWAFTGHCAHFEYIKCEKWSSHCLNCPQKKEYPKSILVDNSYKNFSWKKELFLGVANLELITPSDWLFNLTSKSFLNKYKIQTIHNGIDQNIFKPTIGLFRETYNLKDKFIILGVSSIWTEKKGLNSYIKLSRIINKNMKIVLVGKINRNKKKKVPNSIICIDKTSNLTELAEIYSSADVFLNLTLEDNFPTVNLEAQSCGTPVITLDTGGSKETLISSNSKLIYKYDDQTILDLFSNINKIDKSFLELGKNNMLNKYNEIYKKIGVKND